MVGRAGASEGGKLVEGGLEIIDETMALCLLAVPVEQMTFVRGF